MTRRKYAVLFSFLLLQSVFAGPDEGMWTFDNPPLKLLKDRYGFVPTPEWLDHVRLASVRFNDGGSGSFVSSDGLVLTNHHVARGQLQKLSTAQKDYVKDGFYARTMDQEVASTDLELNVLVSMENVTGRVMASVKPGMTNAKALTARKAAIAQIENESARSTGLRSDVVTLYHGGEYWLYCYKKYTDVRLVFAPEAQAAFFGGDPDNFTFPRHDLDMAIFRVYEDGKPVKPTDYLRWNAAGAADGDLVFVSGHPGSTDRLQTMAQLEFSRDNYFTYALDLLKRRVSLLKQYSQMGTEQAREAASMIFGLENGIKVLTGEFSGLNDQKIMGTKRQQEQEFKSLVQKNIELKNLYGDAWDAMTRAQKKRVQGLVARRYRSVASADLANTALAIVKYVAEVKKPNGERLQGFHDSQLESLRFELLSPAPVYPGIDELLLADGLQHSLDALGPRDPFIVAVLHGRTPAAVAKDLVQGTQLGDPAVRKALIEGGEQAVASSKDPMIVMARSIDPILREAQKWHEENVESVETAASEMLGKARFAVYGKSAYPDATFTLRLSYGTVAGYPMNGTMAPPRTTFHGLYDRAMSFSMKHPFDLPPRFLERKDKVNLSAPLDFVSTDDVVGGNSGSPVIDRDGKIVGLVFDGNIESLVGNYVYNQDDNRTVSVHAGAIVHALRVLYDAIPLADELEGTGRP